MHFAPHLSLFVVDEHGMLHIRDAGASAPAVSGSDELVLDASGLVAAPEEVATRREQLDDIDFGRATEARRPYESSSLQELRVLCKSHALRVRGTKTELVDRLVEALA